MQCRNCGTEIADKAIICYRCGQGTTDPVRKPAEIRAAGRIPFAVIVLPLLLILPLLYIAPSTGHPDVMRGVAVALLALSAILMVARFSRRR